MDDLHRRVERGYDAIARRYADVARANRGPETYFRTCLLYTLTLPTILRV